MFQTCFALVLNSTLSAHSENGRLAADAGLLQTIGFALWHSRASPEVLLLSMRGTWKKKTFIIGRRQKLQFSFGPEAQRRQI